MLKKTNKSVNCRSDHHPEMACGKRNASTPISTEARRRLRLLSAELAANAARIELAARWIPAELTRDARRKFSKGAASAVEQIVRSIPVPPLVRDCRSATWRYLRSSPERRAIDVRALVLNGEGPPGLRRRSFGLTLSQHALGRLLDRSLMKADPVRAALEAHDALLALDPNEGRRLFALPKFLLPGRGGAFLMAPSCADGDMALAIARTWIHHDQLDADQQLHADAWAQLLDTQPQITPVHRGSDNAVA